MTAKEIESLKDGLASEKSCNRPSQRKSFDLSPGEEDASTCSPAASSGPDSQPKLEDSQSKLQEEALHRLFGTPLNHTLKKGMPF